MPVNGLDGNLQSQQKEPSQILDEVLPHPSLKRIYSDPDIYVTSNQRQYLIDDDQSDCADSDARITESEACAAQKDALKKWG